MFFYAASKRKKAAKAMQSNKSVDERCSGGRVVHLRLGFSLLGLLALLARTRAHRVGERLALHHGGERAPPVVRVPGEAYEIRKLEVFVLLL